MTVKPPRLLRGLRFAPAGTKRLLPPHNAVEWTHGHVRLAVARENKIFILVLQKADFYGILKRLLK
ncbi:MAG TPA: hypothetical protein IAA63_02030 [Candidatus Pullilachnospira stercoravium]|uniref:Uncharacterized protein n=1 Tax=Candidatus Pullilachnospira stercoravium TaxID=2840913 RepID=A0A9D1T576_9FIRM|nr:hypothetical protein [Candidatus Pullilachnospira stercoravium]